MKKYLAISGGVGGAKLGLGLTKVLDESQLAFLVNTGDDFQHAGLNISPDLDTLMYTLSGLSNEELGWGRFDESWDFLDAYKRLGGESWFQLGDRDLAVHLRRTELLKLGNKLSAVTKELFNQLGVDYRCWPMSETEIATKVNTSDGVFSFQHYFVRDHCEHKVESIMFSGSDLAEPPVEFLTYLKDPELRGVIICPSNPFLSIDPILSIQTIRTGLISCQAPVIAVSPIVNGESIKGPTSKIMSEMNLELSARSVAQHYKGLIDGFLLDTLDTKLIYEVEQTGCKVMAHNTLMSTLDDKRELAQTVIEICNDFS